MKDLRISPDAVWKYMVQYDVPTKNLLIIGQPVVYLSSPEDFTKAELYKASIAWASSQNEAPRADEFRRTHRNGRLYVCDDLSQFNTDHFDAVAIFNTHQKNYIADLWRVLKEGAPMVITGGLRSECDTTYLAAMGMKIRENRDEYGYWVGNHRKDISEFYKGASHAKGNT